MSSFSRNPGDVDGGHGLSGRRDLLPFEAELCNTVGITADQYFEFLAEAEATVIERDGYENVPDVRAELTTTLAIVQLVVGLALTAAAVLLQPKPRSSSDERIDIKRPDQIGPNRFTPTFGFDSVQELARLGQTVPLVFADQVPATQSQQEDADKAVLRGGTRANSLLTFSLLSSLGGGQRLRVISVAGFCGNKNQLFRRRPDYDGLAFGDQLVRDYNPGRVAAYFKGELITEGKNNDGPLSKDDQYSVKDSDYTFTPPVGNPSRVYWHPTSSEATFQKAFSGARNPGNENEFGLYSPMPNGNFWKIDFQMYILPDAARAEEKDRIRSLRQKIDAAFPLYGAITSVSGTQAIYELNKEDDEWKEEVFFEAREGVTGEDIRNQVNQQRFAIDAALNEGDMYLLNNQLGILESKSQGPFDPDSKTITCKFRLLDDGSGAPPTVPKRADSERDDTSKPAYLTVPHWIEPGKSNQIQRFSEAVISNNVACDCTEIGIGSTVWKRFQGANVNNFPGEELITELENNDVGGTYDIGRMDAYVTRYSFFHIQVRRQGDTTWSDNINGGGTFAVKGNTPTEQFNAIRIYHPRGQYEFRMRPYPSKLAWYRHKNNNKKIYLLDAKTGLDVRPTGSYSHTRVSDPPANFEVWFEGRSITIKEDGAVTNKESIKGEEGAKNAEYKITSTNPSTWKPKEELGTGQWVNDPTSGNPAYTGPTYSNPGFNNDCKRDMVLRRILRDQNKQRFVYFWNGVKVGDKEFPGEEKPSDEELVAYQTKFDSSCANAGNFPNDINIRYQPRSEVYRKAGSPAGNEVVYYYISRKKRITDASPDGAAKTVKAVGGSGTGLTFTLQKYKDGSYDWEIKNKGEGYKDGNLVRIAEIPDPDFRIELKGQVISEVDGIDPGWWDFGDTAPLSMITDYYHRNTESSSHKDRPEHRVTYVNEIILAPDQDNHGNYRYLASLGFTLNSSKQLTSLAQLSAYYQKGLRIKKLGSIKSEAAASNIFPEIAYFLLTNRVTGAGGVISKDQIDEESFGLAADFCRANQYYWDGVIDERVNLREFIHEQASYCLLDFTMKGGKFGLSPTVPYNSDLTIKTNDDAIPEVKALFTDGNMREMKVTTLPPEERKLSEIEVLYREERINQFPQTRTMNVRLERYPNDLAVETFDLTQFCTSRRQALNFAKYALKARQWIDHVIEFQTTPQSMMNVEPGDYIRVVSHLCHPDRFATGHVTQDGIVQTSQEISSGTQVYYWNPTFTKDSATNSFIRTGNLTISSGGKASNAFRGCVFAVVSSTTTDRIYKVDTISIGEEGFVTVTGTHMPIGGQGQLKVMTGWDDDRDFIINNIMPS